MKNKQNICYLKQENVTKINGTKDTLFSSRILNSIETNCNRFNIKSYMYFI